MRTPAASRTERSVQAFRPLWRRTVKIPRVDPSTKMFLESVLPGDERIHLRPMFGNVAAFLNGHMFSGTLGETVFVRLSEKGRKELLALRGASPFETMKGRAMAEYVTIPKVWRKSPEKARGWVRRSIAWVETFPPKERGKPQKAGRRVR